ncbi:MAG: hypothetical protein ACRDRL_13075 [Sciscionella sp.]
MTCRHAFAVTIMLATTLLAGCTAAPDKSLPAPEPMVAPEPGPVAVNARSLPRLGTVLVDKAGHTLYVFEPDTQHVVSCADACAGSWPPLMLPPEAVTPEKRFTSISDAVAEAQHRHYGDNGFTQLVEQVAVIEKQLGINDLTKFTPPAPQ